MGVLIAWTVIIPLILLNKTLFIIRFLVRFFVALFQEQHPFSEVRSTYVFQRENIGGTCLLLGEELWPVI